MVPASGPVSTVSRTGVGSRALRRGWRSMALRASAGERVVAARSRWRAAPAVAAPTGSAAARSPSDLAIDEVATRTRAFRRPREPAAEPRCRTQGSTWRTVPCRVAGTARRQSRSRGGTSRIAIASFDEPAPRDLLTRRHALLAHFPRQFCTGAFGDVGRLLLRRTSDPLAAMQVTTAAALPVAATATGPMPWGDGLDIYVGAIQSDRQGMPASGLGQERRLAPPFAVHGVGSPGQLLGGGLPQTRQLASVPARFRQLPGACAPRVRGIAT